MRTEKDANLRQDDGPRNAESQGMTVATSSATGHSQQSTSNNPNNATITKPNADAASMLSHHTSPSESAAAPPHRTTEESLTATDEHDSSSSPAATVQPVPSSLSSSSISPSSPSPEAPPLADPSSSIASTSSPSSTHVGEQRRGTAMKRSVVTLHEDLVKDEFFTIHHPHIIPYKTWAQQKKDAKTSVKAARKAEYKAKKQGTAAGSSVHQASSHHAPSTDTIEPLLSSPTTSISSK